MPITHEAGPVRQGCKRVDVTLVIRACRREGSGGRAASAVVPDHMELVNKANMENLVACETRYRADAELAHLRATRDHERRQAWDLYMAAARHVLLAERDERFSKR